MEMHVFRGRRALSLTARVWQSGWAVLAVAATGPAQAVTGGDVSTLEVGQYACEVPDPQGIARGERRPDGDFTIINASSYRINSAMGTYLRIGDSVAVTSGPHEGKRYRRSTRGTLVALDPSGEETRLRCVLVTRNTQ